MKSKTSFFAAAEAAWPQDEASLTADSYVARMQNGYTQEENKVALAKDVTHMHKVFGFESDGADLIARYDAELSKLLPSGTA